MSSIAAVKSDASLSSRIGVHVGDAVTLSRDDAAESSSTGAPLTAYEQYARIVERNMHERDALLATAADDIAGIVPQHVKRRYTRRALPPPRDHSERLSVRPSVDYRQLSDKLKTRRALQRGPLIRRRARINNPSAKRRGVGRPVTLKVRAVGRPLKARAPNVRRAGRPPKHIGNDGTQKTV